MDFQEMGFDARAWRREFDGFGVNFPLHGSGIDPLVVKFHVRDSGIEALDVEFPPRDSGIDVPSLEFPPDGSGIEASKVKFPLPSSGIQPSKVGFEGLGVKFEVGHDLDIQEGIAGEGRFWQTSAHE